MKALSLSILSSSMFFNGIGIYLLNKTKHACPSQAIIIANLSATEIFIAIGHIIQDALRLAGDGEKDLKMTHVHILWGARSGFYTVWYLLLSFLAIDRFMACNFALKHRSMATRNNIKITVTTLWMVGLTNGLILCFDFQMFFDLYGKYVWLVLDGVLLVIIIVTYSTIFVRKVRQTRVHTLINKFKSRRSVGKQQFVKVIGLIVLTFILFEVVPTTAFLLIFKLTKKRSGLVFALIILSYHIALLTDPLIYIFLQDRVRRAFIMQLRHLFKCQKRPAIKIQVESRDQKSTKQTKDSKKQMKETTF